MASVCIWDQNELTQRSLLNGLELTIAMIAINTASKNTAICFIVNYVNLFSETCLNCSIKLNLRNLENLCNEVANWMRLYSQMTQVPDKWTDEFPSANQWQSNSR